jgi:tetratricopeptide (TPR) repeat protein
MAPEQAAGAAPDVRSDLFSFGVLAHRLAAGVLPGEPSAVAVPPALARLVEACLRPDPEERPGSASEALALLEGGGRREAARVRRLAAAALVAVAVALGSMAWWRIHPTSGAEVLVAPVDTAQLEARERWLGDAVRQMVVNDLRAAWAVDARAAPDASVPPQATLRPRLWRDGDGRLQASLAVPGEHGFQDVRGDSLRDVAEGLARRTVERTVPAALRHPTARELREVCARDPEAWRQLRRARRAARMEHWARVRRLAGDAVARDPGFCMAWLELGLTYDDEDQARGPLLDKAVTLGDAAPGLSPLSRLGVEFARRSRAGDAAGVARVLEDLAALKLQGPDQLYVRTRMALIPFTRGEPETGLPLLERISEEWPRDAAAPKRLADHYLGQGEVSLLPVALRYARTAVSLAPEDVGARASLARALALAGDEASAREQAAVLAMADAGEKQGGSLFDLHMTLGDVEAAAVDARRLLAEPGVPHAHGLAALGTIDLARGDFDQGLAKLDAAAAEYERLHVDGFALLTRWRLAWQSFSLGRPVRPASAPGDSLSGKYARCIAIVAALARMQAGEARDEAATVALRQEIGRLPAETAWMMERATFELILRHARQDWAGVVAGYRDLASRTAPVRLGRPDEAARVYERLATHPSAWLQPYRRGQAWLRLGILRQRKGDAAGARQAFQSLLGLWDHAPRGLPEIREAERRLKALPG